MLLAEFFRGGHWGQCLELLSHLCQYSESIILVSGPEGIGKSSLKDALMQSEADNFAFCEVQVSSKLDADSLMGEIDASFDEPLDKDIVLLLENAQNLSVDVMSVLLELKKRADVQRHMQIVLFASPDFEQKMLKSGLKKDFSEHVHMIELEPLTLVEAEAFLAHQWHLAGNDGPLPWDKAKCKKLYSQSDGIPGKLRDLSRDLLYIRESNNTAKSSVTARGFPPVVVGSVVSVGLLFCLMAFLWPAADNKQIKDAELRLVATPIMDQPVVVAQNTPAEETETIAESALEPETDTEVETKLSSALQVAMQHEQKIQALEKKVEELQQELAKEREARKNQQVKKAMPPTAETTKKAANYSKDEKHILGLPAKNYTLQLIGSSNEAKIKDFIKTNNLNSKAHYFKTVYQGKPWFIVIYGNYPSRSLAVSALDNLSASVKKLQPWPREFAYIQSTIKKN